MPATAATPVPALIVRTSAASESTAWKQQVHDACAAVVHEPLAAGPVALRVHCTVARRRNWAALWKPAIDALGPVLGVRDARRPFQPDDDRIVDLEPHRTVDDSVGDAVVIEHWWSTPA
ncbi:hypothetical protein [Dactylosporangium sp. NPDC051541]|uniref:hypothetical protein n=1 Tax=Dactylosporangium sp. NPDC051541 TaxID=3363977 RepID=UPI00378820BA